MTRTYKVLSLLLSYPTAEILSALADMRSVVEQENLLPAKGRQLLHRFMDDLAERDLWDSQERYVFLFDQTRSLSLHLFEHVHGESRDRGQAMVDLLKVYEDRGLAMGTKELPDHLPLFLEFLSTLPATEAQDFLAQPLQIIAALGQRLKRRDSVYADLFDAIRALAAAKLDPTVVEALLTLEEDDPNDFEALDRIWEEEAVRFGGGSGKQACPAERIGDRLRAATREEAAVTTMRGTGTGGSVDA
ncbi:MULTISPECIES: nitrate reductase molybdenum cofactor assembly chaperone [Limibacillus]|jgi:nitrate reductase delta subunit|uniref:Nitrate reductase delta subunit n=1 Tax=Limibacillus halophilus TaxID=1579333 RepID=A0A839T0E5_9PROT|nr:nitrate reductase molybdenum cofactor assembly chaperone [Limibacillus halophilus]MBB3066805.1 nitrate reductase delta subunit [Limibacillus halophilus]